MKSLKKADCTCVGQHMHNIEDVRVKIDAVSNKNPERKSVRLLKAAALRAAKFGLKRLSIWILENPDSILETLQIVKVFLEALAL